MGIVEKCGCGVFTVALNLDDDLGFLVHVLSKYRPDCRYCRWKESVNNYREIGPLVKFDADSNGVIRFWIHSVDGVALAVGIGFFTRCIAKIG